MYPVYKAAKLTSVSAAAGGATYTPVNKNNKGLMIFSTWPTDTCDITVELYSNPTGGEAGDTYTFRFTDDTSPIHIPFRVKSLTDIDSALCYIVELI